MWMGVVAEIPATGIGMRGQQDIAGQGAHGGEAVMEVLDDIRVARVADERVCNGRTRPSSRLARAEVRR
jgi:hypothetical protein